MINRYPAIGVVEVNFYTNAVILLDMILKTSDVTLLRSEKLLGGRMVTLIFSGSVSAVNSAIEEVLKAGELVGEKNIKVAVTIGNPHEEIVKLIAPISIWGA